jgi:DNA-binding transcriptional regulator LsrR (DeoR family)
MPSFPDLRIITKAARLYYEEQLTQTEIAGKLGISQVAVSRLLKKAEEHGIVRTTVITPPGAFAELEGLLEQRFDLSQMVIAEAARDTEEAVLTAIGSAAAHFVESILKSGELIGISSWSASFMHMWLLNISPQIDSVPTQRQTVRFGVEWAARFELKWNPFRVNASLEV